MTPRVDGLTDRRRQDVVLAVMPVIAIVLLVGLVGVLLWYVDRGERDAARTALINDALWVEQTLRFQLSVDEDAVARLALDAGRPDPDLGIFLDRARVLVANSPEVLSMALLDGDGVTVAALPATNRPSEVALAAVRARPPASARPAYGPLRAEGGAVVVDVIAPVSGGGGGHGAVVATLSVTSLFARHVPWWIAERYAVRLVEVDGRLLAEKARVEPLDPELLHRISFDPPIAGTVLEIAPYRLDGASRGPTLLVAAIGALAIFAVLSLLALQRHIARRKRVEEALQTETAFRRAMESSLTVGMRARDRDGRIIYVNPAFCRMMGWSAEELVGAAPPMPYWLPDQIEETRARHDAQVKGELKAKSWETRFRRKDGRVFDALVYEAPLVDAAGETRGWMGSIIDVSDRKAAAEMARLQAETLQRTSRLVTLGEMASTLAHELNQPLAAIASYATGSLNMIRAGTATGPELEQAMEKLSGQAQRAGRIIRRIQDFVRKREPRFGPVSVAAVLEDTVAFTANDARNAGVRIALELEPGLPPVTADRILVEQVILNLVRNGVEAMATTAEGDKLLEVSAALSGGEVTIEVSDRGCGIDPALAERLFDPFTSTKAEGMGMGLNICRSILELHHGRLFHAARPGGGTIFTVTLPVAAAAEAA